MGLRLKDILVCFLGLNVVRKVTKLPIWSTMERRVALAVSSLLIVWFSTNGVLLTEQIGIEELNFNKESHAFILQRDGNVVLSGNLGRNFDLKQFFQMETCNIPHGKNVSCFGSESVKFAISEEASLRT